MTAVSRIQDQIMQEILQGVASGQQLERVMAKVFSQHKPEMAVQGRLVQWLGALLRRLGAFEQLAEVRLSQDVGAVADAFYQFEQLQGPRTYRQTDEVLQQRFAALPEPVRDGCPDWLEQLGQAELGPDWPAERAALAQSAPRFIRVNLLKTSLSALQQQLRSEGIVGQPVKDVPTALQVLGDGALFQTRAFREGWFEQQDAGSQLVAAALPAIPGSRVIDACAGAGGKSLALAAQMQGKGRLLAMDVEQWKLEQLALRAKRAGAGNIEVRQITSGKTVKRLAQKADFLLLDVPCSGSGVLRRNPDAKWQQPMRLHELRQLQQDILQRYSRMLAPGGELVYATCSIFPSENEQQIRLFLSHNSQFSLQAEQQIRPAQTGFDGFYWARLRREAQ